MRRAPYKHASSRRESTASPAAVATGLPERVPAWYTGPSGRQLLHNLAPAAESGQGQAPADDLAEAPQVRGHAEEAGGTPGTDPEAGDHLVEDQQGTRPVACLAQALEEPGPGGTRPMLAATGSTITAATSWPIWGTRL